MRNALLAAAIAAMLGCYSDPPVKWTDTYPAKGVVKVGGKAASDGVIQFRPEDPANADFVVTADVAKDGTGSFTISTGHAHDRRGERKPGAPAGKYTVTYSPPQANQTASKPSLPITGSQPVVIITGDNNLTIDLPAPKK
jgi:hypothetical protein